MSNTVNRFVIVYSHDHKAIEYAYSQAVDLFGPLVTPIMHTVVNVCDGFTVWTCGSSEGWSEEIAHMAALITFTGLLRVYRDADDKINPLVWSVVGFDEGHGNKQVTVDASCGDVDGTKITVARAVAAEWSDAEVDS